MNSNLWEEQTKRLYSDAQSEMSQIGSKIAELQTRYETLKREADAYEVALQGYLTRIGKPADQHPNWINMLKDKSHKEKIITIAQYENGKLKLSRATDIIFSNRLTGAKKRHTAYSMIQGFVKQMVDEGIFRVVQSGEYELVKGK